MRNRLVLLLFFAMITFLITGCTGVNAQDEGSMLDHPLMVLLAFVLLALAVVSVLVGHEQDYVPATDLFSGSPLMSGFKTEVLRTLTSGDFLGVAGILGQNFTDTLYGILFPDEDFSLWMERQSERGFLSSDSSPVEHVSHGMVVNRAVEMFPDVDSSKLSKLLKFFTGIEVENIHKVNRIEMVELYNGVYDVLEQIGGLEEFERRKEIGRTFR